MEKKYSVVIFKKLLKEPDEILWVIQCLEHNICAQAATLPGAMAEFERTFSETVELGKEHGFDAIGRIPKAPPEYWNAYDAGVSAAADVFSVAPIQTKFSDVAA